MKKQNIAKLLLLLIAGSLILFLGGLGAGIWIARSKVASEEQEVNRRLAEQTTSKFLMLSADTNPPPKTIQPRSNSVQQTSGSNSSSVSNSQ